MFFLCRKGVQEVKLFNRAATQDNITHTNEITKNEQKGGSFFFFSFQVFKLNRDWGADCITNKNTH